MNYIINNFLYKKVIIIFIKYNNKTFIYYINNKMKIDDKDFKTYLLDNLFTIKRRFSKLNNVIPDYIHFDLIKESSNYLKNEYKSLNLINSIKNTTIKDIENVYNLNTKYFNLTIIDFSCLWCNLKYKSKIPDFRNEDYYFLTDFIEKHNSRLNYVEDNMSSFLKKLKDKLDYNNKTVEDETLILAKFEGFETAYSTKLDVTKIKKEYVYTVNVDSCYFFDSINLSNDVPFAVLKEFYKISKGFKPLNKWIFLNDEIKDKETIVLKVSNKKNTQLFNESNDSQNKELDELYSDVYITFKSSWDEYLEEKKQKEKKELKEKQQQKLIEISSEKEKDKQKEEQKDTVIRKIKRKTNQTDEEEKMSKLLEEKKELKRKEKEEEEKKQKEIIEKELELEKKRIEMELEETIKQKKKEYKVFIEIEIDKNSDLNDEEMLQRVLSCFSIPVKLLKQGVEKYIQSEVLIPNQLIDFTIFKDLMFTNLIFKKFLQLDERLSIYKYKRNMYFYFIPDKNDSKQNYIACSIKQNKVEKIDTKIISKDPKNLTQGTNYIQLKIIRCNNLDLSEHFVNIFCKYISYYNTLKNKIIKEYGEILPNINKLLEKEREVKEQKRQVREKEFLKDIDPEQFIPGYARICEKKFAPKILNKNEIEIFFGEDATEENIEKRKHIMVYPKTEDEGNQHYYSCLENKKKHYYPGLQKNYLDNFDKFPVVPCCFVVDQSTKLDSPYNLYYGKDMNFEQIKDYFLEKEETDTASHVIKTQKIISSGRYGVLPKDIISFLHSIDPTNQYYRKGSLRSVDSVIDALLYSRKSTYDELTKVDKLKFIKQIKNKMINLIEDNNIKFLQESYNVDMKQMLLNDSYIDPHIFYPLLEYIFDCNIFIFKRDLQNPNGILSCPYFEKEYLQFEQDTKKKYVLIYEHMGSEADNAKYPQCELIFKYNISDSNNNVFYTYFEYNNFIQKIDNSLLSLYPIRRFKNINLILKKYKVQSYGINEYGKTVNLILKKDNKTISIITNPLPPLKLNIPQINVSFSKYNNFNNERDSYEFGIDENIKLTSCVNSGYFYGFQGKNDYLEFYIPTRTIKTKENIIDKNIDFPILESKDSLISISKLDIYNQHKNNSRLLVEYFYYLFSIDYHLYNPKFVNQDYIDEFINRNIVIDSNVNYDKILSNSRIFDIEKLKKENKYQLPLPSKKVLYKLIFNLKLKLDREYLKLLNYNNLQYIPSFYSEVDDFKYSLENNINVVKGKYQMIQWIKSTKNNYTTFDYIQLPRVSIYHEIKNILDENQINNLLLLTFVSKWSKPSKNIQNKLYSTKTSKLVFDKYKKDMTIIYIDIDNHKAISDFFSIKTLPTFIFSKLDNIANTLKVLSRIEGDIKMYKNIKLLNYEIKHLLNIQEEDELSNILKDIKNDEELDTEINKALESVIEELDISFDNENQSELQESDIEN